MNSKKLKEIVEKKAAAIQKNLEQIAISNDPEEIHKFRVSYKKLRAFIRLASKSAPKNKQLANLRPLYREAGTIRDLQVYLQSIEEYFKSLGRPDGEYPKLVKNRIEYAIAQLRLMIKDFNFDSFHSKLVSCLPKKLTKKTIRKFTRHQVSWINKKLTSTSTDKNIHAIRKHLKDLLYNRKHLTKLRGRHQLFLLRKKETDQIASALGNYNDNNVAISNLNASLSEDIPSDEKEILAQKMVEHKRLKNLLKIKAIQPLYLFRHKTKK